MPESLFNKVGEACNFIKKETLAQEFSCEFCEISKNTFFTEHLWWLLLMFAILQIKTLYSCDKKLENVFVNLKIDLINVLHWFQVNSLKANPGKFQFMKLKRIILFF